MVPVIMLFLVRSIAEYDIWFHLTIGKDIITTGELPVVDRYSVLSMGRPLLDSQWLYQVLLATGYKLAGIWWLQAVQVGAWGSIFALLYRSLRVWATPVVAWLLVLASVIVCEERFTARPEAVTVLMIVIFCWLLQQGKFQTAGHGAIFVVMQILWSNSHGAFLIGPFLISCYVADALFKGQMDEARKLGILALAVASGCLVTPYGWESIRFAWLLYSEISPQSSAFHKSISEFQSPFSIPGLSVISFWFYIPMVSCFLITWMACIWSSKQRLHLGRTLICVGMLGLSMTARRNLPLFAVVAAPAIAEQLAMLSSARLRRICCLAPVFVVTITGVIWSPRPALDYLRENIPYRFGFGISNDKLPVGLAAFLDRIAFAGPIFNSHTIGGFYAFYGFPKRIPFYDARLEAYSQKDWHWAMELAANPSEHRALWDGFINRFNFQGLLLNHVSIEAKGLLSLIASDRNWRLVYLDQAASFWLRTDRDDLPPAISETEVADIVAETGFHGAENLDIFLDKTALFPEQRLTMIERFYRVWKSPLALKELGVRQLNQGRMAAAEATFLRLDELVPNSRTTLTTLAQIALLRGDTKAAEKLLLKGLEQFPNDSQLRRDLASVRTLIRR